MTQRVLITDVAWPDTSIEDAVLSAAGIESVLAPDGDESTLSRLAGDVDGILTCFAQVTRRVIEAGPHIRVISRTGVGLDNIDLDAASERGIPVTRVPDYCVDEVSEHALALALSLLRRVPQYTALARTGSWGVDAATPIHRIRGSRAFVLGRGQMGSATAHKLAALGMELLDGPDGADLLSIHVPLTDETRGMVDAAYLGRLAPHAVVVNTSRGGVVDHDALRAALESGQLSGAGLDVLVQEPPSPEDPLLDRDDVVVTGHVAFYSEESLIELRTRAAQCVVDALKGDPQ